MKATIVVPSNRRTCAAEFILAWGQQFSGHDIILVEDNPEKTFEPPARVKHYSWKEIDADLGVDAGIISRRSGAIRSYGVLKALELKPDMIVMLDDDCLPEGEGFLEAHWRALETPGTTIPVFDTMWPMQTPELSVRARGFPKIAGLAKTVLNHGLWNNIPDLDGTTQKEYGWLRTKFERHSIQVPIGTLFPMSAMNVAFRPEFAPAMYQMPMGEGQPYHRFDDIWCGWIMKLAADRMVLSVRSGAPFVKHMRASDPDTNIRLEAPGIKDNEYVLETVESCRIMAEGGSLDDILDEIHATLLPLSDSGGGDYWEKSYLAAKTWRRLCRERL